MDSYPPCPPQWFSFLRETGCPMHPFKRPVRSPFIPLPPLLFSYLFYSIQPAPFAPSTSRVASAFFVWRSLAPIRPLLFVGYLRLLKFWHALPLPARCRPLFLSPLKPRPSFARRLPFFPFPRGDATNIPSPPDTHLCSTEEDDDF